VSASKCSSNVFGSVPIKGWDIDAGYFHTAATNFFDPDALGNSNIFFPLTIEPRAHSCVRVDGAFATTL